MNTELDLQQTEQLLTGLSTAITFPEPARLDAAISPENLRPAASALQNAGWGYLSAITGVDLGPEVGEMEAMYHFNNGAAITTLRIRLPRAGMPVLPSISDIIPPAMLFEREMQEMLGFNITGLDVREHLFLPDDWPDDVFPLRAEFANEQAAPVAVAATPVEPIPAEGARRGNTFVVPIGPQHPALKEPAHFEFTVDGEVVTAARVRLGFAHRGIEKLAESRNWFQNLYLFEHVCGICSHTHSSAYSMGVEKLAKVEVPPRALAIRALVAELERIHSHMLWLGVSAHEAGFDTLFMYSWRDRETVMNLLEQITGNRVNYSANLLGGVKCDIGPEQAKVVKEGLVFLAGRIRHYLELVTSDTMFLKRTQDVGTITHDEAVTFGLIGPTARASNVSHDVRVEAPYGAYQRFPVTAVTSTAGDLAARFVVRLNELLVSCEMMQNIIDDLPEGPLVVRMPRKIPAGETIVRTEAPRGELVYYIKSNGGETPARVHIRTPSICNWVSVINKAVGSQLADMPMLISGMDPCFSCNDRLVVVARSGESQNWSWKQLREYGIAYYKR